MYPSDVQYTKDHEWIRIVGSTAEIGITDFAQQQLGDVVFVELPDVGTSVSAGQSFGTIESVKAVSELFAPVSGTVTEVNDALTQHPETVNSNPHDTWIIKVSLTNSFETDDLLDGAAYEALVTE